MQIDLSDQEKQVLLHIIDSYYSSLREEIYKTEAPGAKDDLKGEEETVKKLLERLRGTA
jgi:hypothetical protein